MASQKQLEGTRISREGDSYSKVLASPSKMVGGEKQRALRSTITLSKHTLQIFTDASKEGCDAHLNEHTARET